MIEKIFTKLNRFNFHIFSKEVKEKVLHKNLTLQPINSNVFSISMANSLGVICGAGFETPAEAIYLKKKLLVIPMKNQFEQKCNAFALKELGYKVTPKLNKTKIENWLKIKEKPYSLMIIQNYSKKRMKRSYKHYKKRMIDL